MKTTACDFKSDDTQQMRLYLKGRAAFIMRRDRLSLFTLNASAPEAFDIQYCTLETDKACRAHFCSLFLCVSPDNNL